MALICDVGRKYTDWRIISDEGVNACGYVMNLASWSRNTSEVRIPSTYQWLAELVVWVNQWRIVLKIIKLLISYCMAHT